MSGAWVVVPVAAAVSAGAAIAASADAVFAGGGRHGQLMRPLAEAARLLRQRRRAVPGADTLLRTLGCALPVTVAMLMALVVPFDGSAALPLPVGLVWFNAADVLLWAGWWLIGWGSNSVYGLVGAYRFLAQALAYELPLMFALATAAVAGSSLDPGVLATAQRGGWYMLQMPVAAAVFVVATAGFAVWGPLAHPLGVDAAGGLGAELSGAERLLVMAGRYALLAVSAAMGAALFLGGPAGPGLPGWLWSTVKSSALLAVLIGLRRLPVLPAERVMRLAWLGVLPLTLAQLLFTSVVTAVRGA